MELLDKGKIIKHVAESKEYSQLCRKLCLDNAYYKDMFQELIIILSEQNEDKLVGLHQRNELKFFIIRVIQNQLRCKTSTFSKKYRNFAEINACSIDNYDSLYEQEVDSESDRDYIDLILDRKNFKDKSDWYESNIAALYLSSGSIRKVVSKTGIPNNSVHNTVKSFKRSVKARITELSKIEELMFLTCEQKRSIIVRVIKENLDVESVVSALILRNKICQKKAVLERY